MRNAPILLATILVMALLFATVVNSGPANAQTGESEAGGIFSEIEGTPPPISGVETLASRFVGIDFGQLAPSLESVSRPLGADEVKSLAPRTVRLNLFEDATFTGRIEHAEPTASGYAFWGGLDGVEMGTMTMVVNGSVVAGMVRTPEGVFTIETADSGAYVVRQIDESTLPPFDDELLEAPGSDGNSRQALNASLPADDGSVIDVMVVYTPAAKNLMGGRAGVEAMIDLYVAQTNQAFANSGALHRIRLVLREEVEYVESGETLTDIIRLIDVSDGYMDRVHSLRDTYAADLVHLVFAQTDDYTFGGRGQVGGAFATSLAAPTGGLVFAHELGHNMGLHHDRYQLLRYESEAETIEGSNYGYVNQRMFEPGAPESARWRTIMAYGRQCVEILGEDAYCPRLLYFSNPRLNWGGDPMGVSVDNTSTGLNGPADAVRTLNERREITANFRRSVAATPRVGLAMSRYRLSEKGGTGTITATLHRPSSEDTTVTVSVSPATTVTLSRNRTLTIPAGRTVSSGTVTLTAVDNDDRTGSVEVTVSGTATNASREGVIPPRSVKLYVLDDEKDTNPAFAVGSVTYTFTAGNSDSRILPLATGGNEPLTYSISPEPGNGITFVPGPPSRIEVSTDAVVSGETGYVLTATDSDGDTDSLAVSIAVRSPGCAGGVAVSGYTGNDIISDCEAMLASRDALRGEQSLNWSVDLPIDDWEGVELGFNLVYGVKIREAGLSGILPAELGNLQNLVVLWLDYNDLGGPIPPELANLSNLRSLGAGGNNLNGPIPPELGDLSNLSALFVGHNDLSGSIPPELGKLPNLSHLFLSANQLSGPIPPELANASNLEMLSLGFNGLSGPIPPELGNLTNLEVLGLAGNKLTGPIPSELGNLTNLKVLNLSGNKLTGPIPPELGNLTNLEVLNLSGNQFSGCLPYELLDVPENHLDSLGVPPCSIQLSTLTISPGSLVPAFDSNHSSYDAVVGESRFTLTATHGPKARLQILDQSGSTIADADGSLAGHQVDLDTGITVISLRISIRDGNDAAGHYTIWVNRARPPDAPAIASITPEGRSLAVIWNAPVETGGASIASYDLRYIESDAADKSDSNWTVVSDIWTGGPRRYTIIGLEADVSYDVQVRAVHGGGAGHWSASLVGTPTEIDEVSNDASLSSLSLVDGAGMAIDLMPMFASDMTDYSATVANAVDMASVSAPATHSEATVSGDGDISLDVGANTITVTVTAEDGTTMDYTVMVNRVSNDASLSSLSLTDGDGMAIDLMPMFASDTTNYSAMVGSDVDMVTVSAGATHSAATVTDDAGSLEAGDNTITVTVTAEDGTTMTYTIIVTVGEPSLLEKWDMDASGHIDLDEVSAAIDDYFEGNLTLEEVSAVIDLYFM